MNKPAKIAGTQTVENVLQEMDAGRTLSVDLVAAFAEIEGAAKDKVNPAFRSKYADIGSVIDAIKPVLARHSLAFYQRPQPSDDGVLVQTLLRHASGEEVDLGTLYVPANKKDAQGFGSALTYARRYALMTAFGVPAEDDDGNAAVATARPSEGEDQPGNGPAPRTKLEGQFTSKTALKNAVMGIANAVRKAKSNDEINEIVTREANRETVKQAERDWPELITGDPRIEGDDGLKGYVTRRRAELAGSLAYQLLVSTLNECANAADLRAWMQRNGDRVSELDGEESRKFEALYDEKAAALKETA